MRKMQVCELLPGMRLAQDVYYSREGLLLLAGFIIKPRYIKKLELFGVPYVYIDENDRGQADICEEKVYSEAFSTIKHVMASVRYGKDLDVHAVKETVNNIIHKVINHEQVFTQLTGIRDIDSYTFHHSVDVCIYSLITGKSMGCTDEELIDLGIGAILHDIGKCRIPSAILMKPSSLTEEEFNIMKLHTVYGHEILSNTSGLTRRVADIAMHHHEKWDGTGYPSGAKGCEIDKFARIVAISDVYDALTADRVYRKKNMPHEAAEYIVGNSSYLFDPDVAKAFIRNVAIYPDETIVLLNDGKICRVIEANTNLSLRPKVCVISDKNGPPVLEPYIIDLMENPNLLVTDILG